VKAAGLMRAALVQPFDMCRRFRKWPATFHFRRADPDELQHPAAGLRSTGV